MKIINKNRQNKGITLIALVITIIVLLILAGVSIAQLSGNGLFDKALLSREKTLNAQEEENSILNDYSFKIGEIIGSNRNNNDNYSVGEEVKLDFDDTWHICDGSILKASEYPELAEKRSDLYYKNMIDFTPEFTADNSRVQASGSADGNWPAWLVFSPTLVSSAGSGWISQGGTGEKWISIDMETTDTINKMEFTNVNHQDRADAVGAPIDFKIQGSDDNTTWNDILNIEGNEHVEMGEVYSYTFQDVSYRYYRIYITDGVAWWDGNAYYGFRFWKLMYEEDCIKLPNDLTKMIKIK